MSAIRVGEVRFSAAELRDLAVAWVALGVAFSILILEEPVFPGVAGALASAAFARVLLISMLTVGVGFLLHELAHKVVAVRFGQIAGFRADYGMLALCVGAAKRKPASAAPMQSANIA